MSQRTHQGRVPEGARLWVRETAHSVVTSLDPASRIKLSDADRDAVSDRLADHYATGHLSREEHHARLDAAFEAKTRGDIPPLFYDLPGGSPLRGQDQVIVPPWVVHSVRGTINRGRASYRRPSVASRRRAQIPAPLIVLLVLAAIGLGTAFVVLSPLLIAVAIAVVLARGARPVR